MPFPSLNPTSRSFDPGDWPIKSFRAQSGAEVRILYGSARTGMAIELSYENIADSQAETFLTHYNETLGTLRTFTLPSQAQTGWSGSAGSINVPSGNAWRYAKAPALTAVRPGVSTVTVSLVGVV